MLALEVTLLTGRYVATSFDDRSRSEWPPHPARLFSALCAAHFEALEPSAAERDALSWLEGQGDPEIAAPEVAQREVVTTFVPVNDLTVVGSFDDELLAIDSLREERERARNGEAKAFAAAEKKLKKAEAKLTEEIRKAIQPFAPGKENKDVLARADRMLPERRTKQPRTFPSVASLDVGSELCISFSWPAAEPSREQRAVLDSLAARVARLGHSSSLVSVRVGEDASRSTWVPADGPDHGLEERVLRGVQAGQIEALEATHKLRRDEPGRVLPSTFRRYVRAVPTTNIVTPKSTFGDDWLVFRRIHDAQHRSPRLPSWRGPDVASTFRRALMSGHGPGAPEILTGHITSGAPSERPHLAYVPLPFVGHPQADGALLGIALVLPRDLAVEDRRTVFRALDAWEKSARAEGEDHVALPVHLGRAGTLWLAREEGERLPATLKAVTWSEEAVTWSSATPVALDRNPGDLRSSSHAVETKAYREAEETISVACTRIGLPRPRRVTACVAAPLAGGDKARAFAPFKSGGTQRVLVHATIQFESAVRGPVLLGSGRYFGLGLFRPVRDSWTP